MQRTPTLLVHGGAWAIPDDMVEAHRLGVSNALAIGYALLEDGATAVEAVEAAVTILEDDETFDAGRGSFLTSAGRVQLDALLMDGSNLRAGGVACVERLRNPIQAARLVLDKSPHVYFVGAGARRISPNNMARPSSTTPRSFSSASAPASSRRSPRPAPGFPTLPSQGTTNHRKRQCSPLLRLAWILTTPSAPSPSTLSAISQRRPRPEEPSTRRPDGSGTPP